MPSGLVETTTNLVSPGTGVKLSPITSISIPRLLNMSSKGFVSLRLRTTGRGDITSPFITGLMNRFLFKRSGCIIIISFFCAGARTTLFASLTSAFLILMVSPTPTPVFILVRPSILAMLSPTSEGYALATRAPVFLWPSSSTMSPSLTPRAFMVFESILTIPLPNSSRLVSSPTFNVTPSFFFIIKTTSFESYMINIK